MVPFTVKNKSQSLILEIDFIFTDYYYFFNGSFLFCFWKMLSINVLPLKKWTKEILKTVKEALKKYEAMDHWKNKCDNKCKISSKSDVAV